MIRKKILLVEDHPVNMKVLKMTLKSDQYQLLEALDGEEALARVPEILPDLIILDIQIPKVDGCEVARRPKGHAEEAVRAIPILALTAYAMKGDKERIEAAGCDVYMSKPFEVKELRNMVAALLGEERNHA